MLALGFEPEPETELLGLEMELESDGEPLPVELPAVDEVSLPVDDVEVEVDAPAPVELSLELPLGGSLPVDDDGPSLPVDDPGVLLPSLPVLDSLPVSLPVAGVDEEASPVSLPVPPPLSTGDDAACAALMLLLLLEPESRRRPLQPDSDAAFTVPVIAPLRSTSKLTNPSTDTDRPGVMYAVAVTLASACACTLPLGWKLVEVGHETWPLS